MAHRGHPHRTRGGVVSGQSKDAGVAPEVDAALPQTTGGEADVETSDSGGRAPGLARFNAGLAAGDQDDEPWFTSALRAAGAPMRKPLTVRFDPAAPWQATVEGAHDLRHTSIELY